jgi:hypothetical protein
LQHMQHLDKACATSKMKHTMKHICRRGARCPRSPVTGAANGAYKYGPVILSRTPRAGHSLSSHHALFGHTAHARAPHTSGRMRSQALTRGKDRCGPRLTATARVSFFLVITPRGTESVRSDGRPQPSIFRLVPIFEQSFTEIF